MIFRIKLMALFAFCSLNTSAQDTLIFKFENGVKRGEICIKDGLLSGDFKSYYKSGKLKAEGGFLENQRIGNWSVYDTTGVERVTRNYIDNRSFTEVKKIDSLHQPIDRLKAEQLNVPDSTYILKEKDVLFARTLFMEIEHKSIATILPELINCAKSKGYKNELLFGELSDSIKWDLLKSEVENVGVNIQVIWIYDSNREMSFTRMFALGLFDKSSSSQKPFCWIWYPDARDWLKENKNYELIKNLDKIHELRFELNCFTIKSLSSNDEDIPKDELSQGELLFDLFDLEHIFWYDINAHVKLGNQRFPKLYL